MKKRILYLVHETIQLNINPKEQTEIEEIFGKNFIEITMMSAARFDCFAEFEEKLKKNHK